MDVQRLPDGNLRIPVRVEGDNGELGDGTDIIGPAHPDFAAWEPFAPPKPIDPSVDKGDIPG